MLKIHTGKEIKKSFEKLLRSKTGSLEFFPVLNIIQIGDDFASTKYVEIKTKMATDYGLKVNSFKFSNQVELDKLQALVTKITQEKQALIFQLPIDSRFQTLIDDLDQTIDADLLGLESLQLIQKQFLPPTILAIHLILGDIFSPDTSLDQKLQIQPDFLVSKTVAVIGQGKLVGRPLLDYLVRSGATVLSLNKDTKNIQSLTQKANIVISATGKAGLINSDYLSDGSVVIDAGTSESSGALVGDVDKNSLEKSDKNITLIPSPGGIGKLTVLSLFWNVLRLTDY